MGDEAVASPKSEGGEPKAVPSVPPSAEKDGAEEPGGPPEMMRLQLGIRGKEGAVRVRKKDMWIPPAQTRLFRRGVTYNWCEDDRKGECPRAHRCKHCHVLPEARQRVSMAASWTQDPSKVQKAMRPESMMEVMQGIQEAIQRTAEEAKKATPPEDAGNAYSGLLLVCATAWILHSGATHGHQGECPAPPLDPPSNAPPAAAPLQP
eukprot:Hpha_TRINITY_DN23319_c0_g1::TRINITY_DN23319_c0_g1_i1::g.96835::m.96835